LTSPTERAGPLLRGSPARPVDPWVSTVHLAEAGEGTVRTLV